jgi:hypothetical protein
MQYGMRQGGWLLQNLQDQLKLPFLGCYLATVWDGPGLSTTDWRTDAKVMTWMSKVDSHQLHLDVRLFTNFKRLIRWYRIRGKLCIVPMLQYQHWST